MSLLLHLVAAALLIAHLGDAQVPAAQALPGPGTDSSINANVSAASAGPDTAFRLLPEHNLVDGSVTSLPPASDDGEPPALADGEPAERPVLFERPLVDGERGFSRGRTEGFSPRQGPPLRTCHRPAQCRPLRRAECFGTSLGYTSTSLNLTGLTSQQSVKEELRRWEVLQHIPKCWSVIQPFLCAVLVPRCENGLMELPSLEMCQKVRGPCRFAEALLGWPAYLQCSPERFPSKCRSSLLELKYNTSASCLPPLVPTQNRLAFVDSVEGCAPPCHGLLYTQLERRDVHRFIHVFGGLSFALTFLTVMTHVIDWRSFCKYAANRCIFYINLCLCLAILGFLLQFVDESRATIVCHRDGTRRGPGSEESSTPCTAVFILIYYPIISAMCWFVMLAFSWNITFKTFGQSREIQERLNGLTSYFHLISWSVPLILTTAALATSDVVDSDFMYGVCFVGFDNWRYRVGFVLVPSFVATLVGGAFLVRGVRFLVRQKPERTEKARVVNVSIARLCVCGVLLLAALVVSTACHAIEYGHKRRQPDTVLSYLRCEAESLVRRYDDYGYRPPPGCEVTDRPAPLLLKTHCMCLFAVGALFSSWVWRRATLRSWARFYRRVVGKPEERPVRRIRKHQVIAQAWSKRYHLAQNGRISLSFHSTHSDPVGMHPGHQSGTTESPSSSFFAAIPSLLERRGALIGSTSSALGLSRGSDGSLYSLYSRGSRHSRASRYSRASRASKYSRRLSLDSDVSRRHSLDSTRSLYRSEADRVAALLGGRRRGRRRALADVRRAIRPSARGAIARSDSTLSHSQRSSSMSQASRASSSISSQLLGSLALSKQLRSAAGRAGRSEARRRRRHTGHPAALGLEPDSGGSGAAGGRDNASYLDSELEEAAAAAARRAAHSQSDDGRRSVASSARAASRQSRGHSSNVSSGSSIVHLRQRLLGDVVDFARARRGRSKRAASPPAADAGIELTRLPGAASGDAAELMKLPAEGAAGASMELAKPAGAGSDNQTVVSVAVQTTPSPERQRRPPPAKRTNQPESAPLTLTRNDLSSPQPPDRLNNGRRSPYNKNAVARLSLPSEPETAAGEDSKANSRRSSARSDLEARAQSPLPQLV